MRVGDMYVSEERVLKAINELGLSRRNIHNRIHTGLMDVETALTKPKAKCPKHFTKYTKQDLEAARKKGIKDYTFRERVNNFGYTVEQAINTPLRANCHKFQRKGGEMRCELLSEEGPSNKLKRV